jgi:hypothetical protein
VAVVFNVEKRSEDEFDLSADFYPNGHHKSGSLATLNTDIIMYNYYVPSLVDCESISKSELLDLMEKELIPVFYDDELAWSGSITID